MRNIITLTTDFGLKDPFVGEMKGVILTINPNVTIVDLTHGIEPQNIEEGALVIGSSYRYFPSESIHVCVIDPGVGSGRRPIIVEAAGQYFVGPDNGLFSHLLAENGNSRVVHVAESNFISNNSPTFQGRDVFAPIAALLSRGMKLEEFGPVIDDFARLDISRPRIEGDTIEGKVIYIDSFGNAITSIRSDDLLPFGNNFRLEIGDKVAGVSKYYSEAKDNDLHCLINSSGYLELFVNMGNAARQYGIRIGEKVVIQKV